MFSFTNHTHDWSQFGSDTAASWNQTGHEIQAAEEKSGREHAVASVTDGAKTLTYKISSHPETAAPATPPAHQESASSATPVTAPVSESSTTPTTIQSGMQTYIKNQGTSWEDIEKQREVAFKIVYFFIGFICLTFGLLYAYYKVDKKEQAKE